MVEHAMEEETWNQLETVQDINDQVSKLNSILVRSFQRCCAKHRKGKKSLPPWPEEIKNLQAKARRAHRRAYATNLPEDWDRKREAQRLFKREYRKHSREEWQNFCGAVSELNPAAKLAKVLRSGERTEVGMLRKGDGIYTNSPEEAIDHLLEQHFPEAEDEARREGEEDHTPMMDARVMRIFNPRNVKRAIKSFGPYKAPGPDGIYPAMLQKAGKKAQKIITTIMSKCITLGYVPQIWQKTKVAFLPKPGKARYDEANAFRPVSLTSFLLKAMEKILEHHLFRDDGSKDMHDKQHAYRKGRSTETALHQLVQRLERTLHNKEGAMVAYLDIEGAFNRATFSSMEQAMEEFGIPGQTRRWISYMLRNRKVEAEIKGCKRERIVERGCPQGGVLSPRLWNMVIDRLLGELEREHPSIHAQGYADDVTLMAEGIDAHTVSTNLQNALDTVQRWTQREGLSLNPNKTDLVVYTRKRKWEPKDIKIKGQIIPIKDQAKYLGVIIDKRLTFKAHVEAKAQKCSIVLMMCRRAVGRDWGLKPQIARWIYLAIVRPMIAYAAVIWAADLDITKTKQLTKVQRLACCMITGAMWTTPTASMEELLQLPSIQSFLKGEATKSACRMKLEGQWDVKKPQANKRSHYTKCNEQMSKLTEMSMPQDRCRCTGMDDKRYHISILNKEEAIQKQQAEEAAVRIFTDGSRLGGRTGAAYVIQQQGRKDIEHKWHLGKLATVNQAEMQAITRSAKAVTKMAPITQKIIFFSDSQATLKALDATETRSKLAKECHEALQRLGRRHMVELTWTPGHHGIEGNERADVLAKQGTKATWYGPEPTLPIPGERIRQRINAMVTNESTRRFWGANRYRESHLYMRKQTKKDLNELLSLGRKELRWITAILTGHVNLGVHLKRMRLTHDDRCQKCLSGQETSDHFIGSCRFYIWER
jgi:ribonuclease HI